MGEEIRALRVVLADELSGAPDEDIEDELGSELAYQLEDLASIARGVGQHVQKSAPGALRGAATGFLVGGPAGAVVGGAAGAAQPHLGGSGRVAPAIANPAALQLLLAMLRPEVTEALLAMALGRLGAPAIQVGATAVPVAAFPSLLQSLAERAAAAHRAQRRAAGRAALGRTEQAVREGRATVLLRLLADSDADEDEDDDARLARKAAERIDEAAEARDLIDIIRLGGID